MKTAFSFISRVLAALFSFAVILAIPISQLFFHTGRVIFNHKTMRNIGQETVRELDLPSLIVQHVTGKVDGEPAWPGEDPALKKLILRLEDGEQERLLRAALPQQVISLWAGQVIDSLYQWLDSERALPRLTLDTRLVREQITGREGEKMADLLFESLPPCTARDLATALTSLDDLASPEMILDLACKSAQSGKALKAKYK